MSVKVFNPADYENGVYENMHSTKNITMGIRRGDTRHGDYSNISIRRNSGVEQMCLTLSEARSLKAFLDRELQIKAR